ncbi:hypothetical protein SDJN03_13586, partial [Cucurbita argyrosperma subsp. sororia]
MIEWKSSVENDMIVSFELSFAANGAEMAKPKMLPLLPSPEAARAFLGRPFTAALSGYVLVSSPAVGCQQEMVSQMVFILGLFGIGIRAYEDLI